MPQIFSSWANIASFSTVSEVMDCLDNANFCYFITFIDKVIKSQHRCSYLMKLMALFSFTSLHIASHNAKPLLFIKKYK